MKPNQSFIATIAAAVAVLMLSVVTGYAQGGGVGPDKLELENDLQLNLDEMEKPALETPPVTNKVETSGMTYEEKDIKADTDYEPLPVRPPKPPKVPMDKLYPNFLRLGYGRFASILGDLHLGTNRSIKGSAGLDFSHRSSSNGYVNDAEFRDNLGAIYGEYYANGHTLGAKLSIQNSNYFYFADSIVEQNPEWRDSIRETFTRVIFDASLARNYTPGEVNYDVGLNFNGFFDNHKKIDKGKDIHLSLLPQADWTITDQFGADVRGQLTFSNTEFDSVQQSRFFLDFTPTVKFKTGNLRAEAGIKINSLSDSTTHFGAFPILRAAYGLVENKLTVSAGLQGEMNYLRFTDLIEENRFLDRDVDIRPSSERFNLYLGLDGQVAKYLDFSIRAYTKRVKNQLVYFTPQDGAYFQMLYDSSFGQSGLTASLIFNKQDKIRAGVKGEFRTFTLSNLSHNFGIPKVQVDFWASYNFAKKVWVSTEVFLYGSRVMSIDSVGNPIQAGLVPDVRLSADYRFNERISVFFGLNNILGIDWQRWHNYRMRPFYVQAGATLSF
ncbi:MAG: hypothetical protein AAGN35_05835 [Bacteroidota bacterium]